MWAYAPTHVFLKLHVCLMGMQCYCFISNVCVHIGRHSISWFALELIHESELSLVKYHARIPAGLPGKCYNYILLPFHMDESWSVKASEICKTLNYFGLIFAQLSPIHSRINNSTVLARADNRRTLLESSSQHYALEAECRLLMIV